VTDFQIIALPREQFSPFFDLDDATLEAMDARRVVVDEQPGFPCRVSLEDAEVGETVLLLPVTYHDVRSPYRATGPIYVRRDAETARLAVNEIPYMLTHRLLSVRGYDREGILLDAAVVNGAELEATIRGMFAAPAAEYLHIHNARPGCYDCRVVRA
jgi:hypothetical protein